MAPRREHRSTKKTWLKKVPTLNEIISLATDPRKLAIPAGIFIIFEVILNIFVIEKVPYTEIDWKAYMQEVEGFLNGTWDYSKLKGETGPLVYPAGFVYIFSILYYVTSLGKNVKLAQYFFATLYVTLLILVFRIYSKTKKVPPYALILICCTSYRIHSIFVLRLFNDPLAIVLFFASLNAFLEEKWYWGSIFYSLAVSVKMNILLFAPALLLAYLVNLGLTKTAIQLFICGAIQLILGLPFLIVNPVAYLKGAFDLGRIFEHQWTVNWRFLPEDLFVDKYFHIALLVLHLLTLAIFTPGWITYLKSYSKLKAIEREIEPQLRKKEKFDTSAMSQLFILPLFTANLIGITFSRSLHYQFYVWYYHTLPYLAWSANYSTVTRFVILGIIELCWNTYPSTIYSSAGLHLCHIFLLFNLYRNTARGEKRA
ncbi:lethal(2)neighbour of tid protein [Belonocnema kinseyi]|uniref:lethal(2)neighbour of tid protein n=1 Tax=Belonocnema kinseyi TaxID=2817044 RepID=UPI00143D5C52|nr:lethal(2)neighbour of tid protein [Belonocnema kinseyi]XP_033220675.1 lethal(2)neighbour of tid protein [Belonocnema kinseyi]XP_033220686.1 lethal(2)neighbour of tid protein [Belonocnema kinseyi]